MKYYKTNYGIRAIGEKDDGSGLGDQTDLVQDDWILMTNEEVEAFLNPHKTEEELEEIRIDEINAKARAIIYSKYPQEKQSSAQLGIYGDEYLATMKVFIKQVIDISNKAIDDKVPADEVDWEELDK